MNERSTETGSTKTRIAVVGGGMAGLAAAHRLVELDPSLDVVLLEASPRLGGALHTERREGFLIEHGADSFLSSLPWAVDLCGRIGLGQHLIQTDAERRRAFVVHRGRLHAVPDGFVLLAPSRVWPVLTTSLLSVRGKARLLMEYFVPRRAKEPEESLAAFARRRLGREAFERLVQPLAAGIYTADPEKLSLAATMPRFLEMEEIHGSLWRGARRQAAALSADGKQSAARYNLFVAPREGMSGLVQAVTNRLPAGSIRLDSPVCQIEHSAGRWKIRCGKNDEHLDASGLILACSAAASASLLEPSDAALAADLRQIPYADSAVVSLGYRRDQIDHPLDGFGFVVPAIEKRDILAASFSSNKFPGRAPAGHVLIRVFLGGACQSPLASLGDSELINIAQSELAELIGARAPAMLAHVARWKGVMPQYQLGHNLLIERIDRRAATLPRLALAGNAYRGVGVPQVVRSGEAAAEIIIQALSTQPAQCQS